MNKFKISEVLHLAADKYLAVSQEHYRKSGLVTYYSCCAIARAYSDLRGEGVFKYGMRSTELRHIFKGLFNMGLPTDAFNNVCFGEYHSEDAELTREEIQGQRYMWLKWAALMAEEQGQ